MISLRNIKAVFKKEFLQIMRDKSVLFTNFFIPLFGVPLYLIFVLEAANYTVAKSNAPLKDDTIFTVSYQGELDPELVDQLSSNKKIELKQLSTTLNEAEIVDYRTKFKAFIELKSKGFSLKKKIKKDKKILKENNEKLVKAKNDYLSALQILKGKYTDDTNVHIAVFKTDSQAFVTYFFYSEENIISQAALKHTRLIFKKYETQLITSFKSQKNIQEYELNPFHFWDVNLDQSTSKLIKVMGLGIGGGILFLLLMSTFHPTINTTIGERDQKTFKILLMNPISLHEIFIGKYLNVALQGLLTLIPYFIEFVIVYAWGNSNHLFQNLPALTATTIAFIIAGTISAAIFISSMCFLACAFAKTKVQAQSLITLLMFALMIPIGTIGAMDIKLSSIMACIPLINFPISIENLLLNNPNYIAVTLGLFVNLAASMVLIWFSLGAFLVQWKGSSDIKSLNDILSSKRRKSKSLAPAHAFLAFAIAFLGYVYGGYAISTLEIDIFLFLFSPLLFCLGTSIFITQYSGLDFTKTFVWRGADWPYIARLIVAAFSLSLLFNLLLSNSVALEMFEIDFPVIFESNQFASLASYFLLFAVIPGFSEEILFRGIIFKGLRSQYSLPIAVILSSVFFAVIHFSMFKWGHTFAVGIFLAIMYEKRGLISCIFFHICFNSFGLLFGMNQDLSSFVSGMSTTGRLIIVPVALVFSYFLIVPKREEIHSSSETSFKEAA
ncbi:MAG: CPBP family intramembrane metalloprotease [Bacteriovoracaceae bacterium]|jgi:membrane protease YdiL (CAAX protease family)/ABC-type Na+ efflux pump permease subunit|nr:CPBP family intramembrane metalloprotease [Bacteriovoracaceae bacterium]